MNEYQKINGCVVNLEAMDMERLNEWHERVLETIQTAQDDLRVIASYMVKLEVDYERPV